MKSPSAVLNHPTDDKQAFANRFHELAEHWKKETLVLSNSTAIEQNPAYQEIIQMGQDAIPLILAELAREPDFWFGALQELTGANPTTLEMRGKVRLLADAWLKWGREHGYEC